MLPIVMGARPQEYAAVAPHNSYIHVEEFAGPEELAAYLKRLDEDDTLYNSYFRWKVSITWTKLRDNINKTSYTQHRHLHHASIINY